MFNLIALVTLKEGAPQAELIRQGESLLAGEINIRRFRIRADAGQQEHFNVRHSSFALLCEFDSVDHWKRYVAGDIHARFSGILAPWRAAATVIQFDESDGQSGG